MNLTYKILEDCINSKDIKYIVREILVNYKKIIDLKNLNYSISLDKFKLEVFSKNDYSSKNLFTMFRILENKFYKHLKNMNFIKLAYKEEIAADNSNNFYLTIITDNKLNLDIFKVYFLEIINTNSVFLFGSRDYKLDLEYISAHNIILDIIIQIQFI